MKLEVFSVFDSSVGAYLQPMFFRSKGEAIRAFGSAVASTEHHFNKHAPDFTLFHVGTWDDERCIFSSLPTPVSIGIAVEFLPQSQGG